MPGNNGKNQTIPSGIHEYDLEFGLICPLCDRLAHEEEQSIAWYINVASILIYQS